MYIVQHHLSSKHSLHTKSIKGLFEVPFFVDQDHKKSETTEGTPAVDKRAGISTSCSMLDLHEVPQAE
jgi:hypothetical protein